MAHEHPARTFIVRWRYSAFICTKLYVDSYGAKPEKSCAPSARAMYGDGAGINPRINTRKLESKQENTTYSSSPRIESTQPKRWNSVSTHSKYNDTSFQTNTVHRSPTLEQPHYLIQSLVCVQHRLEKPPYPEAVSISVKYLWMSVGQNIKPQQQQIARTDN